MNREEKRRFRSNAKKRGFTDSEVDYVFNHKPNEPLLWEGAKVKLDIIWMRLSPDWYNDRLRRDYKEWVLAHKDEVFTVVFDKKRKEPNSIYTLKNNPNFDLMVCLEEDDNQPKWLFFSGDLILQPGGTSKPEEKEIINTNHFITNEQVTKEKIQDAIQEALNREKNR